MAKKSKKVNNRSKRYAVGFQLEAVERMKHCKLRWQAWRANSDGAVWKPVFSKVPCEESRDYTGRAASLAGQHLRRNQRLGVARPIDHPADVRIGRGEPDELLSGL